MQVHRDLESLPSFTRAVITIGAFDGVHCGHRSIIAQVKEEARKCNGESVIITFDPHPRMVLSPDKAKLQLLTTLEEKIYLLEGEQIDHLVVVPFTRAFSELSAEAYVSDFLVSKFDPHVIIIGYDHHFGHNREGNIELLHRMKSRFGFRVVEIPGQVVHDLTVSATKIRHYIQKGEVRLARELLGYPYFLSRPVVHGDGLGRQLGFPTANLFVGDVQKLIPASGVYATQVRIPTPVGRAVPANGRIYSGAASIGYRPTFGGKDLRVEVYLLDFAGDLYGEQVQLSFFDYIRPELSFDQTEALVAKMHEDVALVRARLKEYS
jgi:riboflavin kinase/FMN adenylyltransferase